MADYWMKLYIEILDDPKMATLPDRLWRRVIELFLVAKKLNKDGHLPDTRQIAWLLRMSADDLEHDIAQIATTGIVEREVNGWFIPKFIKRQAAVPDVERQQQSRKRRQSLEYNEGVTGSSRSVTQSREQNTENREQNTEAEQSAPPDPFFVVQGWLEELTGVMPTGDAAVKAIDEIVELGATREDVEDGCKWYKSNTGTIRYYSSLVGPIRTAKAMRVQREPPKSNGKPKQYEEVMINGERHLREVQ